MILNRYHWPSWLVWLLGSSLLLSGCSLTRPVTYGALAARDAADTRSTYDPVRLYFDRQGSLYPPAAAGLPVQDAPLRYRNGYLLDYYTYTGRVPFAGQADQWRRLQLRYGLDTGWVPGQDKAALYARWRVLQQRMRAEAVQQLEGRLRATRPVALVVLVHGFNTDVARTWYREVAERVRREYYPGQPVEFLEIYWDGGKTISPLPLTLWKYAQFTMYPTGLALRQVLGGLPPSLLPPVRIMTHSTGGPLTCVALWNSEAALSGGDSLDVWGQNYRRLLRQPAFRTPRLPQLRVAMVAPAMPAAHFANFLDRNPCGTDADGGMDRLLIAQNRHDIATGKTFLVSSRWSWVGATSLGVRPDEYWCGVVPQVSGRPGVKTQTFLLDFTGGVPYHAHGVLDFMKHTAAFQDLLDLWLRPGSPTAPPPAWRPTALGRPCWRVVVSSTSCPPLRQSHDAVPEPLHSVH